MIDINLHISELDLSLEDRYRGNCPVCNGRNTFTVSRTLEGILYNCYKAGCNLSGVKNTFISVKDAMQLKNVNKKDSSFVLPSYVVSRREELSAWLIHNALIGVDVLYDIRENRVVFPVVYNHKVVDATGRALDKKVKPKWKRYGSNHYAYTVGAGNVAVVVEDCISAAVVSRLVSGCVGFALMGTSLLPEYIEQLKDFALIIVALDPDAVKKTLQFTSILRARLDSSRVVAVKLEDDLKYGKKLDRINIENTIGEFNGTGPATHSDGQRIL